jgi:hypothetical protein
LIRAKGKLTNGAIMAIGNRAPKALSLRERVG